MKIALAGIGKIARDQHVPALAASPDWDLVATCSRSNTVEGVEGFTDFDAMLAAYPEIGTVSLCHPPVPRFDHAVRAIRAGRNVMLEKPPGATLAECQALEALARAHGVSLFATWHSREGAQVRAAKDWLAGRRLTALRIVWKEDVRRWHPGQDWIFEAGGLGVFDPVINALSIMTEILSEPVHVTAADLAFPENRETPVAGTLAFFHPGGAAVTAEMDFLKEGEQVWSIEAETDGGTMVLSEGGARLAVDGTERPLDGEPDSEYARLYARMARLVRAGGNDVDLSPMVHVADAFTLARRRIVEPFHW